LLTIVVVGGVYFGYKYYKTKQTSSPNKEKNDRKIKIVLV
jgi:predicted negative regulator of RcsB-dependent stress response